MKKTVDQKVLNKIVSEVSSVARRELIEENSFEDAIIGKGNSASAKNLHDKKDVKTDMEFHVKKETDLYCEKNQEIPSIYYVFHEASDGMIASGTVAKYIKESETYGVPVHNPVIDGKKIETYFNKKAIKRVSIEEGIVTKKSVSFLHTLYTALTALVLMIGSVSPIVELINTDGTISQVLSKFGTGYWIAFVVFFVLFVVGAVLVVLKYKENQEAIIGEVNKAVNEMSEEEFLTFLSRFDPQDFCIEDFHSTRNEKNIYICNLRSYSIRERYIIKSYLSGATGKQMWWIFFEKGMNNCFLLKKSKNNRQTKIFRMVSLNSDTKNAIFKKCRETSLDDDMTLATGYMKKRGVDWIYRNRLKSKSENDEIDVSVEDVNEFVNEYKHRSPHAEKILRLVSELAFNFDIDLGNESVRRDLLKHNKIDELISSEVSFKKDEFSDIVTEVIDDFEGRYGDVLILYENKEIFYGYHEWCIIEAMKVRNPSDDVVDAVMDRVISLYNSLKETGHLQCELWLNIFLRVAEYLRDQRLYWFLPSVTNCILSAFEKIENQELKNKKIFSLPEILELAKLNLILGLSNGSSNGNYFGETDVIRDHYRITVNAVKEENPRFDFDNNNHKYPECFSILRLTPAERQKYFNALRALNKNGEDTSSIEKYYAYIFNIYCMVVQQRDNSIKFFCADIGDMTEGTYRNFEDFSRRYIENNLRCFIGLLKEELENCDFDDLYQNEAIESLDRILNRGISKNIEQDLIYMLAEFDVYGLETYSFIACLIYRSCDFKDDIKDVYLNFNNYLFSLVFLTYHESLQPNFLNDDFRHLISVVDGYDYPGKMIIAYISCALSMVMTDACRQSLLNYLERNNIKEVYIKELVKAAEQIKGNDVGSFVTCIECSPLVKQEDKKTIQEILYSRISDFEKLEYYLCLKEYLSISLRQTYAEEFSCESAEVNIERLKKCPDNIVAFILKFYMKNQREEYNAYIAGLLREILHCHIVPTKYKLIMKYLENAEDRTDSDYIYAVFEMYHVLGNDLSLNYDSLEMFKKYIDILIDEKSSKPELYEWAPSGEVNERKNKIQKAIDRITMLECEDKISARRVVRYGMLLFLRVLLKNNFGEPLFEKNFGECETREDMIAYVVNNYDQIEPLLPYNGEYRPNVAYRFMIDLIINNEGNMQALQSDKMWTIKFTQDAEKIIEKADFADADCERRIRNLIRTYSSAIERLF